MNEAKEVMKKELTDKARANFLEIEKIVLSHRKANRIPTLGVEDLHSEARHLLENILALNRIEVEDAPKIDESQD